MRTSNRYREGFVQIWLGVLIGLFIVGGGLYVISKKYSTRQNNSPESTTVQEQPTSPVRNPFPTISPTPTPPPVADVSGKWIGNYTVSAPAGCAGTSGGWSATLYQSGDTISGNFSSDSANGIVSGKVTSGKKVSWVVSGSGAASFSGSITSPNSVGGNFTGSDCDEEGKTSGTFFGGR